MLDEQRLHLLDDLGLDLRDRDRGESHRTSAAGGGGRYGLFYTGVPYGSSAKTSAWLYGLQQNTDNRSNLAIVNTGETDGSPSTFKIELYDGATGTLAKTIDGITIAAKGFTQVNAILKTYAPGVSSAFAKVVKTAGTNPFLCYAVINDGGEPGKRSDDGAFVPMEDGEESAPSAPSISVSPSSVDFGNVTVGQSADRTLAVSNAGSATLTVSSRTVSGAGFSVVSPAAPFNVAAGGSTTVTLRFAPSAAGAATGTLTIASNDPARPSLAVALSGTGTTSTTTPQIEVTPASLAFGSVATGQTKDLTVTVKNKGTGTLTGTATTAAPFSVTSGASFSLAANATQTVTVRFSPTAAAASNGTLAFSSNGGSASVTLSGTGTSSTPVTVELKTDDGSIETGVVSNGLLIVNRLTPPRYPATLLKIRLYAAYFQGYQSPSGGQIRVVAFSGPSSGAPPANPTLAVNGTVTLPTIPSPGGWVDVTLTSPAQITSGDWYVGYQAPNPAGGVGFAADSSGTQVQKGYFSTDNGSTYQGPLSLTGSGGSQVKVNIMIRAEVLVPSP